MAAEVPEHSRWDQLLLGGALAILAGIVVNQAILAKAVIPPLLVFAILLVAALALRRARWRAGTIATGVVAAFVLLGSIPFVLEDLSHPASAPAQFAVTVLILAGVISTVTAAVALLRRWGDRPAYRLGAALSVLFVVAAAVGFGLASGGDDDATSTGDVAVEAKNVAFNPKDVQVTSGGAVFVTNADLIRHTFTVKGQPLDVEVPAGRSRRIAITLPPGSYPLHCSVLGHEQMKGTLTVR